MNIGLPRCIFFDLDGTLLDSLPGIEYSVRAAFECCHFPPPEVDLRCIIGPPIRTILSQIGGVEDAGTLDALEQAFRASYDSEGWRKTVCYPGANRVLKVLHAQRHRLFVVSNKPRHISLRILEAVGIVDFFECVVTRDSRTPAYSGKAEMTNALMDVRLIAPENALFMGDTMEDAEAAWAVGIRFGYMAHGYGEIPVNSSVPVDFRFDDFAQWLPFIAEELVHDR